jgi:hypothetical protein
MISHRTTASFLVMFVWPAVTAVTYGQHSTGNSALLPSGSLTSHYDFTTPNPTRYLVGSTAFSLEKGHGYYMNTYFLLNSFEVGLTNNFSIGGGFEVISALYDLGNGEVSFLPSLFISSKAGFNIARKLRAGFGTLLTWAPSIIDGGRGENYAGIFYGVVTYGTVDDNVSGGVAWGFAKSLGDHAPALTISGIKRVGKRIAVISENWFLPRYVLDESSHHEDFPVLPLLSLGARILAKNFSVDLGVLAFGAFIPYVDFVVKF